MPRNEGREPPNAKASRLRWETRRDGSQIQFLERLRQRRRPYLGFVRHKSAPFGNS
ncbi:hypothetical protein PQG02_01640 [Nostoc sp. UHCC 0926]|uniref:hypothetical protein n=1 Tax=unclassified Nostoc TaxID=2593658 RepID=UPI00235EDD38|nr:hypothetical protein [Nostoc sp. UHCC 0926]WDD33139.1 hypothetical protein PQG02_01640 [Nostoc sp. UHCC 0926]